MNLRCEFCIRTITHNQVAFSIVVMMIGYTLTSCGKPGLEDPKVNVVAEEVEEVDEELATRVPFKSLSYLLEEPAVCLQKKASGKIHVMKREPIIDANFDEWETIEDAFADKIEPDFGRFDLQSAKIAMTQKSFVMAAKTSFSGLKAPGNYKNMNDGRAFVIELGGILLKSGTIVRKIRRQFKVTATGIYDYEDGWNLLNNQDAEFSEESGNIEIRISKKILGDTFSWPLWFVKIATTDNETLLPYALEDFIDQTSSVYFPSLLGSAGIDLDLKDCSHWVARQANQSIQEISVETELSQKAFANFRLVLNQVTSFLGTSPVRYERFPVIVNSWNSAPKEQVFGLKSAKNLQVGIILNTNLLRNNSYLGSSIALFRSSVSESLISLWLESVNPSADNYLKSAMSTALANKFIRDNIGQSFWLNHFPNTGNYYSNLYTNNWSKKIGSEKTDPKGGRNFGHILSLTCTGSDLITAWNKMAKIEDSENDLDTFLQILSDMTNVEDEKERINALKNGWANSEKFDSRFIPQKINDSDKDGIFDLLEDLIFTSSSVSDTDKDGWTDFAEYLTNYDPTEASLTPNSLVPDGDFSDWLELVPQRIMTDKGAEGECPKSGDIVQYGAMVQNDGLLIGANAQDFWAEDNTRWEIYIQKAETEQGIIVRSYTNSRETSVYDLATMDFKEVFLRAVPSGIKSVEWFLPKEIFPEGFELSKNESIKIRISTVFTGSEDKFCDETDWISPLLTSSSN